MSLKQETWNNLLQVIKEKKCTPIIGPEAYEEWLPKSRDLAQRWSKNFSILSIFKILNYFIKK